jgi:hypothetical protein
MMISFLLSRKIIADIFINPPYSRGIRVRDLPSDRKVLQNRDLRKLQMRADELELEYARADTSCGF